MADQAGFDSVWSYEVYRDPLAMLCTSALSTTRVALGTGLAAAFPRSPFELANEAADADELSDGRLILGLGTGVPEFLRAFHSTDPTISVKRIREYIEILRLAWQYLGTGSADALAGTHYQFQPPPINFWGVRGVTRERIPIYLAAMRPKLMSLTGELADGWIGYLPTERFLEERVLPGIAAGTTKAGRDVSDIDVTALVICSVSPDREVALRRARIHVGFYLAHPISDVVVELHGLQEEKAALSRALRSDGIAALERTDERLVETFSFFGTPEEVREKIRAFRGASHLVLHTPYVPPLTADESDDAYRNIISLLATP